MAHITSLEDYNRLYQYSITNPEDFWAAQAQENLAWITPWQNVLDYHPERLGTSDEPYVAWFSGGHLNAAANCLDRHVAAGRGEKVAIMWHGEDGRDRLVTYRELLEE